MTKCGWYLKPHGGVSSRTSGRSNGLAPSQSKRWRGRKCAAVADIAAKREQRLSHDRIFGVRTSVTPTSPKVAEIGACGLWIVTGRAHARKSFEDSIGDPASGGLDQAIALRAKRLAAQSTTWSYETVSMSLSERAAAERSISRYKVECEGLPNLGLMGHHAVIGVQRESCL